MKWNLHLLPQMTKSPHVAGPFRKHVGGLFCKKALQFVTTPRQKKHNKSFRKRDFVLQGCFATYCMALLLQKRAKSLTPHHKACHKLLPRIKKGPHFTWLFIKRDTSQRAFVSQSKRYHVSRMHHNY